MTMTSQFADMTSLSIFFDIVLFLLSTLVPGSGTSFMFHGTGFTGSGVLVIFFYKGLARNLEIGNISVWVLSNI